MFGRSVREAPSYWREAHNRGETFHPLFTGCEANVFTAGESKLMFRVLDSHAEGSGFQTQ